MSMYENESSTAMYNTSAHSERAMSVMDIAFTCILFILCIVIVAGNLLTILAVRRTTRLRTVANRYVVSLAAADLMAGIVLPFYASRLFPGISELFNTSKNLCLSHYVLLIISAGNSMLTMVQIAVDRLFYIAYPMKYKSIMTTKRAYIIITVSWIASIILGTMPFYYNRWDVSQDFNSSRNRCDLFQVIPMEYQIYVQVLIFCICCFLSGICYTWIFRIAYKQRRSITESSRRGSHTSVSQKFKRDWPIVKMFVLVFGIFFVCWCPAMVGIILGNTIGIPTDVMDMLTALCAMNSGMNFFIYSFKNSDFKTAYRKMLCTKGIESFNVIDSPPPSFQNELHVHKNSV